MSHMFPNVPESTFAFINFEKVKKSITINNLKKQQQQQNQVVNI